MSFFFTNKHLKIYSLTIIIKFIYSYLILFVLVMIISIIY